MTDNNNEIQLPKPIGYGEPPKGTQYKKGQSGNPAGRPRGSKNTYTMLSKMLEGKITLMENGKKVKVTRKMAFLMRLLTSALQGDLKPPQSCSRTCFKRTQRPKNVQRKLLNWARLKRQ